MKSTFKIKGIDCANCAAQLENAISKVEGVESASISFIAENGAWIWGEKRRRDNEKKWEN